jgi:hypothetical protein
MYGHSLHKNAHSETGSQHIVGNQFHCERWSSRRRFSAVLRPAICSELRQYLLDPSDQTACQADFDTMRMGGGLGQDALDNAIRQFASSLVLFQYNADFQARFEIAANVTIHNLYSPFHLL